MALNQGTFPAGAIQAIELQLNSHFPNLAQRHNVTQTSGEIWEMKIERKEASWRLPHRSVAPIIERRFPTTDGFVVLGQLVDQFYFGLPVADLVGSPRLFL